MGKTFSPYQDKNIYSLALDKSYNLENKNLVDMLREHFYVAECQLGDNPAEPIMRAREELTKMMPYISSSDADAPLSVAAEPGLQYCDRSLTPGDITSQIRNPEG